MKNPNINEYPNLALARQGVDYRFNISCRNLKLNVRPLSIAEEDRIASEVTEELERLPPSRQTSLRQSAALAIKKLTLAQTSDVGLNDTRVNEIEIERMTAGEIDYLFKQYVAGCDKVNPMFERLSAEQIETIVSGLKKNSKDMETTLIESSFFHLVDLCHFLLKREE